MTNVDSDVHAVLAQERQALGLWAQGRPLQYFENWAEDITYFDDIGAHRRIDGIVALRNDAAALEGKVPPRRLRVSPATDRGPRAAIAPARKPRER